MERKLSDAEVEKLISNLSGWYISDDKSLTKEFILGTFKESIEFVKKVAVLANKEDHHPDIHIYFNKVVISLSTHSVGGLSSKDFNLATQIESI